MPEGYDCEVWLGALLGWSPKPIEGDHWHPCRLLGRRGDRWEVAPYEMVTAWVDPRWVRGRDETIQQHRRD